MPEAHRVAFYAARREVDQGPGNRRSRADRHRCGAHHRVVQLAHGQGTHQQVDIAGLDRLAAGSHVVRRRCHEGHLWRVLTLGGFVQMLDQAHAQRAIGPHRLEHRQGFRVAVDCALQLGTGIAQVLRVDEDCRDTRVDQRGLEGADTRHLQVIDQVACGEHRTTAALFFSGRVQELQLHFGGREGHAVQFEVAGFLHRAVGDRYVGDDGLADIGLPDPHHGHAVAGHAGRVDQARADGEGTHRRRQVAAVAAPVDERFVDGDLAEQVVHVMLGAAAFGQDHGFAGARRGAAHAVDLLVIGIGAADHPQQQGIACGPRDLRRLGQVLDAEKHTLAGAATHVGGGDLDLRYV